MVSPAMPALTGNGLAMRTGLYLQALTRIADVDLLIVPVFGEIVPDNSNWAKRTGARIHVLERLAPDTHFGLIMRMNDTAAQRDAFSSYNRPSICATISPTVIASAVATLRGQRFDLVHVERSYCAPIGCAIAASTGRRPTMTMDLDEDDSHLYSALADLAGRTGRWNVRAWNLLEAKAFERLLSEQAANFDRIWVSSIVESARLNSLANPVKTQLAPNANFAVGFPDRRDDGRTLLFVGSLGYVPNQDAASWFLSSIWPRLARARNLRLRIVGANPPTGLRRLARQRGVEMTGWVPSLAPYYAGATLSIAPIRAGAGTRIKLLESAAYGVPIVSTTVGAEGLGMHDGCHLWLADHPEAFSAAVEDALAHPEERRRRARAARGRANSAFDRRSIVGRLSREFLTLL